ncbi:MAG: hypothetical protein CFE27_14730 [Alphaproteobacteria bacterium PA1]|nr:MAG: hypothetical protein CFE27_14730 [Alphaproteobacteria bacterium PA1]
MLRVHFSCGAASAVSLLLACHQSNNVDAVYADTGGEHPDNMRFLRDVEAYTGVQITIVKGAFDSPLDVWRKRRYMKGPNGASCTTELKRLPLMPYWTLDRDHIMGFDVGEKDRLEKAQEREAPFKIRSLLIEKNLSKKDCFAILDDAGIALPEMYKLGFRNANCIGCPKGGKGYWNHVRKVFPKHFADVAQVQREIGIGAAFWEGEDERLMLDELSPRAGRHEPFDMSCDMFCSDIAERAA